MAQIPAQPGTPALNIARIPGEFGPVLRCSGDLTVATGEALRRELDLLTTLRHPALILDVSGCRSIDVDGVLLLLDAYKRLREKGARFAIAAGTDRTAHLLRVLGIDTVIPVFPTEATAVLALRGGGPPETAPVDWSQARAETLAMWREIQEALREESADEIVRRITYTHGLCRRAEELLLADGSRSGIRCYLCPLFHALGGRPEDVGCESVTQPLIASLLRGDRETAQAQVARVISLIETMPLPQG